MQNKWNYGKNATKWNLRKMVKYVIFIIKKDRNKWIICFHEIAYFSGLYYSNSFSQYSLVPQVVDSLKREFGAIVIINLGSLSLRGFFFNNLAVRPVGRLGRNDLSTISSQARKLARHFARARSLARHACWPRGPAQSRNARPGQTKCIYTKRKGEKVVWNL